LREEKNIERIEEKMFKMKLSNLILLVSIMFISCDDKVFDDYKSFEDQIWNTDSILVFKYAVRDTTSKNNLIIKVRHTTDYQFQNLYLFVRNEKQDTLELMLANKEGKWLGRGVGDIREFEYVYRKNKMFSKKEEFILEIEQAMRYGDLKNIQYLQNIKAVGLSITSQNE
tara:strand:+ start:2800 stop:3309 length:510 start_codon:yes stop_codon:yes gene_type:complete